jgi:hypothetical protein
MTLLPATCYQMTCSMPSCYRALITAIQCSKLDLALLLPRN